MFNRIVYKIVFLAFAGLFASAATAFPSSGALQKCASYIAEASGGQLENCTIQGFCVWFYCTGSDSLAYAWVGETGVDPFLILETPGNCPSGYAPAGDYLDQCVLSSGPTIPTDPTAPPIDPDDDPNLATPPYCPI